MPETIFEISHEMLTLEDLLNDPETTPEGKAEATQRYFEIGDKRDEKLDGYMAFISELTARAKARKEEALRLLQRVKSDEEKAEFLKNTLVWFFTSHELKTVETARHRLTLTQNGGCAPVLIASEEELPVAYLTETVNVKPNRDLIREALELGQEVPGASLGERSWSIRVC